MSKHPCEAPIGQIPATYGFLTRRCGQVVGLRQWYDSAGRLHAACQHHVAARVSLYPESDPPEPSWDLGRDPDYDDPPDAIDQYKGWTESEKAYGR